MSTTATTSQTITSGTSTTVVSLNLPPGTGYRIRALADNGTGLIRSGKTSNVTILAGQSSFVNISLADVTASFSPSNPTAGTAGSAAQLQLTVVDPGDIVENRSASLYSALAPFVIPGAPAAGSVALTKGTTSYSGIFSIDLPISGAVFYYSCRIGIQFDDEPIILDLPGFGTNLTISLSGWNVTLMVSNIPASATRIGIAVDGGPLTGTLWGSQSIASNTSSSTVALGVPSGGPYRIRVFASSSSGLLRSGKATSVFAPASGSTATPVTLSDLTTTMDSGTPTSAAAGSSVQLVFDIADPGDVVEDGTAALFCSGTSFYGMSAANCGAGVLTQTAVGVYRLTFQVVLQAAGSSYNYAWRVYCGSAMVSGNLDFPSGGLSQAILLSGSQVTVSVTNIPQAATHVTALLDGGGLSGVLRGSRQIVAGTSSTSFTLTVPAGSGYRLRVYAFDALRLYRSGKVSAITIPSGGTINAAVDLNDVTIIRDAVTPLALPASSLTSLVFDISDPGDVVEDQTAELYYGATSFALPAGTYLRATQPVRVGDGHYTVTFAITIPVSGNAFYYGFRIPLQDSTLDSPYLGAASWKLALGVSCTYSVQPTYIAAPAAGLSGTFSITSATVCPWNAQASATWVTLAGTQRDGTGTLSYTISPTSVTRSSVVRLGNVTVTIAQSAPCTYEVSPATAPISSKAAAYTVQIVTPDGCSWNASAGAAWISLGSTTSGAGAGSLAYNVAANSGDLRSGTITLADQMMTVQQHAAYSSNAGFVRQLYLDLLNRSPDSTGLTYWASLLDRGMTRDSLAASFFQSVEFGQYGLYIIKLYSAVLGRLPDTGGLLYWTSVLAAGTPQFSLVDLFINSREFVNRFGNPDNATFVSLTYQNVLGRPPDTDGLTYWTAMLNGGMTRAQLIYSFVQSQEFDTRIRIQAYALLLYVGLLRRDPDPEGLAYWCSVLETLPLATAVGSFIYSPEYISRY